MDDGFEVKQQWTVLGVRMRSSTRSLSGYLGEHSVSIDITNVGVDSLSTLTLKVGLCSCSGLSKQTFS